MKITLSMTHHDAPQSDSENHLFRKTHSDGRLVKRSVANLLVAISVFSLVTMIAGMLGKWHFLLDLASHLRVQAIIAVLASGVMLAMLGRRRVATACVLVGIGMATTLTPYYWPPKPMTGKTYRLMTANVLTRNTNKSLVLQSIHQMDPDFVLLQETDNAWTQAIQRGLHQKYPYHRLEPRDDNFGIAMFSKHRWSKCEVISFSPEIQLPSLIAEFQLPDGTELQLIATHPLPPIRHSTWTARNRAFKGVAKEVQQRGSHRTIVAGDLNSTPWSYWFKRLLKESGLRDSSRGQGLQSTWNPTPLPFPGLVIDHVLVGSEIEIADRMVGPSIGSDHRPVIVDFR